MKTISTGSPLYDFGAGSVDAAEGRLGQEAQVERGGGEREPQEGQSQPRGSLQSLSGAHESDSSDQSSERWKRVTNQSAFVDQPRCEIRSINRNIYAQHNDNNFASMQSL